MTAFFFLISFCFAKAEEQTGTLARYFITSFGTGCLTLTLTLIINQYMSTRDSEKKTTSIPKAESAHCLRMHDILPLICRCPPCGIFFLLLCGCAARAGQALQRSDSSHWHMYVAKEEKKSVRPSQGASSQRRKRKKIAVLFVLPLRALSPVSLSKKKCEVCPGTGIGHCKTRREFSFEDRKTLR